MQNQRRLDPAACIAALPFHTRLMDGLACLLFDADDVLGMLDEEDANRFLWLEPHLRKVNEEINLIMHRMTN